MFSDKKRKHSLKSSYPHICLVFFPCRIMGRPKKTPVELPKQTTTDPNMAKALLANAKALVAGSVKRKAESDVGSVPTPCKAKSAPPQPPPCPKQPQHRIRSKSPAQPTAPAPKSSAFEGVTAVLAKAKALRLSAVPKCSTPPPKAAQLKLAPPPKPKTTGEAKPEPKAAPTPSPEELPESPHGSTKSTSPEHAPSEATPPAGGFTTPSPKPNLASPPSVTSVASTSMESIEGKNKDKEGEGEDDYFCNSQVEYYGRQGKSWWRPGADWYPCLWYYDYDKKRHMTCWGDSVWDSQNGWNNHSDWGSDWGNGSWERSTNEVSPEEFGGHESVRHALATRQPSFLSQLSGAAGELETPSHPPSVAPSVAPNSPGEGTPPSEPDTAQEGGNAHGDAVDDRWRKDKYGNPLSPHALYMRFYRRLRSTLAHYQYIIQINLPG